MRDTLIFSRGPSNDSHLQMHARRRQMYAHLSLVSKIDPRESRASFFWSHACVPITAVSSCRDLSHFRTTRVRISVAILNTRTGKERAYIGGERKRHNTFTTSNRQPPSLRVSSAAISGDEARVFNVKPMRSAPPRSFFGKKR